MAFVCSRLGPVEATLARLGNILFGGMCVPFVCSPPLSLASVLVVFYEACVGLFLCIFCVFLQLVGGFCGSASFLLCCFALCSRVCVVFRGVRVVCHLRCLFFGDGFCQHGISVSSRCMSTRGKRLSECLNIRSIDQCNISYLLLL